MRFLIVNTDYKAFVRSFYSERPGLAEASYAEQLRARNESLFGVADFYSSNLRALGHEAEELHANVEPLQRAWAAEHGLRLPAEDGLAQRTLSRLHRLGRRRRPGALERVLAEQIGDARPDVLLVHDMVGIKPSLLAQLRDRVGLVVGQHAASPIRHDDPELAVYDLVLSSFPPTVEAFRRRGLASRVHRLGFEPRVLDEVPELPRRPIVTFVGSLYRGLHDSRIRLLEQVAAQFGDAFELWAPSVEHLAPESPLRDRYRGPAWGRDMYRVLRESAVTLNEHGNIAPHANNCRLYEATGVGTLLVTDWKPDLRELFALGDEVAAYRSPGECLELVESHLARNEAREAIAAAGQRRTLREHTYRSRMEELVEMVEPLLPRRRAA
jgi:spore maturation protein CgeB